MAKESELQASLDKTRRAALEERARLIADAQKAERQILDEARAKAEKRLVWARSELQTVR